MSKKKIVAIIPARGGSKRLPRKNVLPLNGKPLIHYSIEAALQCSLIDDVIVTSEDTEICEMAAIPGVTVINRPHDLAEDHVKNELVVKHAIESFQEKCYTPDYIVLLQPTSPLRNASHLEGCLKNLLANPESISTMSVCAIDHHPAKYLLIEDGYIRPYTNRQEMEERSQLLHPVYRQNGAIYAIQTKYFLEELRFYREPCLPFLMDKECSIDIDNSIDWQMMEIFLKEGGHSESIAIK